MSAIRHFEATGKTKSAIQALLNERFARIGKLKSWAKKHGGKLATRDSTWGFNAHVHCAEGKAPKDAANWKFSSRESREFFEPKNSTKGGKALIAELAELTKDFPGKIAIAAAIKVPWQLDLPYIIDVGVHERKGRIIVSVNTDKYKPPKTVSLKRISDMAYEKLTARKP